MRFAGSVVLVVLYWPVVNQLPPVLERQVA
jgi:hypothetical protein